MSETTNLGLHLTGDTSADKAKLFGAWRKEIAGTDSTSNMNIIDAAIGDISNLDTEAGNLADAVNEVKSDSDSNADLLDEHIADYDNPHQVTAAQVGAIAEPSTEGTNGQILTTNGAGGRSWSTVQGGVTSVNTQTGAVVLDGNDINVDDSATSPETIKDKFDSIESAKADKSELPVIADTLPSGYTDGLWVDTDDDSTDPAVRWDVSQTLTDVQKGQARTNIGAASSSDLANKADKQQAVEDAGKVMTVGADGVLAPSDLQHSSNDEFGVVRLKSGYGFGFDSNDNVYGVLLSQSNYNSFNNRGFLTKGTVESVREDIVRRSLLSNSQITDADKPAICAVLGAVSDAPYELIETITLDEDAQSVMRTMTPAGKNYDFSNVHIEISTQPYSVQAGKNLGIEINGYSLLNLGPSQSESANEFNAAASVNLKNGRIDAFGVKNASVQSTGSVLRSFRSSSYYEATAITRVRIDGMAAASAIPAGSVIKIYAVWR